MRPLRRDEILNGFWTRVYSVARFKGYPIQKLAERIGYSPSYLTTQRSRNSPIPADKIVLISEALGCSTDYLLLGRTNEGETTPLFERLMKDRRFFELVEKLSKMPADKLAALSSLLPAEGDERS